MLRIPTFIGPSSIHGLGLFTPAPIASGTIVWELTPQVDWRMPHATLDNLPEPYRSELRSYCYLESAETLVLCGDNAKFMNHSFEPNCDDPAPHITVARRNIEAGEELTVDYRLFDHVIVGSHVEPWRIDKLGSGATLALQPSASRARR